MIRTIVAGLVLAQAAFAQADDVARAKDLINRMITATDDLNYIGTFVYQRGDQLDTMRIIHRSDASGIHERLIALTGYPREVLRDNEDVTCIFPESKAIIVEKRGTRKYLPTNLPYPIEGVAAHYDFEVQGVDRVAGREAWVVNIEPRDADRFGYRLWIDRESHLLLKSSMMSGDREPLQQVLFTDLTLPAHIPDSALTPQVSVQGFSIVHDEPLTAGQESGKPDLEVNWLPEGFTMRDREIHPIASSRMPVDQRVYSDGLAMVSVFVEQLGDTTEPLEGLSQIGAVTAYGQVSDHYQVTVVGEIPDHTIRRIAKSIVIKPKG